jgi:hypothetical protein
MNGKIQELEHRLAATEKKLRMTMLCGAAAAILAAGFGCGSNSYKTLKAQRVEIVDGNGKTVGLLFADEKGGVLSLDDAGGKPRLALSAEDANPRMEIYDGGGKVRATLNAEGEGSALALCDANGVPRANLFYFKDQSWVGFFDAEGKLTTKLPQE